MSRVIDSVDCYVLLDGQEAEETAARAAKASFCWFYSLALEIWETFDGIG